MFRNRFATLFAIAALTAVTATYAREGNTLQDEFRIYSAETLQQCESVKSQLKSFIMDSDPLTGYTLKDSVQSLCVCIPAKLEALKAKTPAADMAKEVTEKQVHELFDPAVVAKCAGEQMRGMYAEDCPKRFKLEGLDAPKYCACMKDVMSKYSEADTVALASAAADYLPKAAEAEKNELPLPQKAPILEGYFDADQKCKGDQKSFEQLKF